MVPFSFKMAPKQCSGQACRKLGFVHLWSAVCISFPHTALDSLSDHIISIFIAAQPVMGVMIPWNHEKPWAGRDFESSVSGVWCLTTRLSSFHLCFLINSFCLEATGLLLQVLQHLKSLRSNFSRMDLVLGVFPSSWQNTYHECSATGLYL